MPFSKTFNDTLLCVFLSAHCKMTEKMLPKFFYVIEQIGTIAFAHIAWKLKTTNKNKDRREFFHCNHVMEQYPEPLSTEIDTIDKNQFRYFTYKVKDLKFEKHTNATIATCMFMNDQNGFRG